LEANVELAASGYLYTIALIAISFAGLSVLIMIFRQMLGGQMTERHSFVSRQYLQLGFMTTFGSILPPLLELLDIPAATNWRLSSAVMAVILGWWALTFQSRRHAVTPLMVPKPVAFFVAMLGLAGLALAINAIVAPAARIAGIYAASVTVILICGGGMFLYSLISLYEPPRGPKRARRKSPST
jgi:hypothetical protein